MKESSTYSNNIRYLSFWFFSRTNWCIFGSRLGFKIRTYESILITRKFNLSEDSTSFLLLAGFVVLFLGDALLAGLFSAGGLSFASLAFGFL